MTPKQIRCSVLLLIACLPLGGQSDSPFDLKGILELVDRPPDATSVEALNFRLHPLGGGPGIEAQPDREGRFTLSGVASGHYSLTFPMPGRIQTFADGSRELAPEDFELKPGSVGPLRLIVGMKSGELTVQVRTLPAGPRDVVALLAPADTHLTLRESCYLNPLTGNQTTFRFVPPGKYRIFVVDARLQQDVAARAPRSADFLKNQATPVEVVPNRQTEATAAYIENQTVQNALSTSSHIQR